MTTNPPSRSTRRALAVLVFAFTAALGAVFLGGCADTPKRQVAPGKYMGGYDAPKTSAAREQAADAPDPRRPGLGTGFGEERESSVSRTNFVRADGDRPSAVDRIYYNDRAGIDAMLAHEGGSERRASGLVRAAGGLVSAGLRSAGGRWLDGWVANGRRFVAGERGERYEIVVRNETRDRIEVVLSVDGLDVMDGRGASFRKRGYIVHAGDTLTVDGFRTSSATVAAFRFSRVDRSYAALKHGDTRNVGVVGLAVFTEREPEVWRRSGANPFPGSRWATPPE